MAMNLKEDMMNLKKMILNHQNIRKLIVLGKRSNILALLKESVYGVHMLAKILGHVCAFAVKFMK